ncbi:ImuA family protein [Lacibacterium aquatile]|uniref:ImuA family protein n=1 Tax=Lacibacterium aquatile TaxID=1168082 RepID=A0ABW5E0C6_9PROT
MSASVPSTPADTGALRQMIRRLERPMALGQTPVSFGDAVLDGILPWGGLPTGALHEVSGPGALGFALAIAGRAPGRVMRIAPPGGPLLYGPGLARFALTPRRLILADAKRGPALLWALEEALKSKALGSVIVQGADPDLTETRRLQLAAEAGGSLALLIRDGGAASSALTRWHVTPAPASADGAIRWTLDLLRCRGGRPRRLLVEWQDEALCFHLVSPLGN